MADETPIHEVRRVIIEYEIRVPTGAAMRATPPPEPQMNLDDIVEKVRREFIRIGSRNPDIFGGRA